MRRLLAGLRRVALFDERLAARMFAANNLAILTRETEERTRVIQAETAELEREHRRLGQYLHSTESVARCIEATGPARVGSTMERAR